MDKGIKVSEHQEKKILENYKGGPIKGDKLIKLLRTKIGVGAKMSAKKLILILTKKNYRTIGLHKRGSTDKNMHYTIMAGSGYHLLVDKKGTIWRITDKSRSDLAKGIPDPWKRGDRYSDK